MSADRRRLRVIVGGLAVDCESLDDAEGLRKAADILDRADLTPYSQEQLERLAEVLRRCGRSRAARTLIHRGTVE